MVKLLVLSDLHLESADFEPDADAVAASDVIVLAGDILPVHGHMHHSFNYQIGGDKRHVPVVCNPRGFSRGWTAAGIENPQFNPGLLITLLPGGNRAQFYEL